MANTIEIVKPMTIEVNGMNYVLEFNRNSVMSAERAGLSIDNIQAMPMNTIPLLFYAAFKKNHPKITKDETDKILIDELHGLSTDELKRLIELFNEPTKALIRGSDGDERKNSKVSL